MQEKTIRLFYNGVEHRSMNNKHDNASKCNKNSTKNYKKYSSIRATKKYKQYTMYTSLQYALTN